MKVKQIGGLLGRASIFLLVMTLVCGLLYTLLITGAAQLLFPHQANGSVIEIGGKTYGSSLLAQEYTGNAYLWGRMMKLDTTTFQDKDGNPVLYAWPRNLSPASPEFEALVAEQVARIKTAHPQMGDTPIPADLVTSSGSGLDPAISPDAADYQLARVAAARGMGLDEVQAIVARYTTGRFLGVFGEPTVNVLQVNLALDGILKQS